MPEEPRACDLEVVLHSRGDTRRLGKLVAGCVRPGDALLLEGPLGAGKTFLARAIARGLGVPAAQAVTSPTFDLVHELEGCVPVVHADLYRLDIGADLDDLGIVEAVGGEAVVIAEWALRFADVLGGQALVITLSPVARSRESRRCALLGLGARGEGLLSSLRMALVEHNVHGPSCPT